MAKKKAAKKTTKKKTAAAAEAPAEPSAAGPTGGPAPGGPQPQMPMGGMPQQGMPQQMPQQGMPQQMPMQGMPQQMPMPGMQMPMQGMPQQMPMQGMPQQPGGEGGMPMGGYGGYFPGYGNPMAQMMQMMQGMMGVGGGAPVDPSAQPFVGRDEQEVGLEADVVEPALIEDLVKEQAALPVQDVLDRLCLRPDGKALGGLPKGCTIAFAGPPGKGKTRAMLEGVARAARAGVTSAYVVAEEGFRDEDNPDRDDLCSRFAKIAMAATGLDEAGLREHVLPNVVILLSQYHRGHTWDDFIRRYRYAVEELGVRFVVVDSLNTLDPSHARTSENLAVLKTYNHEHGVTCVTIGQIKDSGEPVGGEALMHTADAVILIEEMSLGSKDMAEFWGGKYRQKITVIRIRKCVTTPVHPYPVRVDLDADGRLVVHEGHPEPYALPELP